MHAAERTRIGLMGGTFNPIHLGHLIVAQTAFEAHDLSKVLFIPSSIPPHKEAAGLIPAAHRMAMVEAAIEGDWRFETSDAELRRGGVSYAIDTVRELCRANPDADLYFIVGADTLFELHLWKDIYDLLPLCTFVSFSRRGRETPRMTAAGMQLDAPWPARLAEKMTVSRMIEISSTEIRYRVAEGLSIRYLVPSTVEMYIAEHGLYRR